VLCVGDINLGFANSVKKRKIFVFHQFDLSPEKRNQKCEVKHQQSRFSFNLKSSKIECAVERLIRRRLISTVPEIPLFQ
jgi:hypothetical protein